LIIVLSMTIINDSYDARRAAQLCGFKSTAMLDYLQRSEVFIAKRKDGKRRGKGRRYDFRDLLVLKAIATLKKSLAEFQNKKWFADPAMLEDRDGIIRYLIVSGDSVMLKRDANVIVDLSRQGQLTFSFIIDLENLHTELCKDLGLPVIEQAELVFPTTA
jgi:hypothetical protein